MSYSIENVLLNWGKAIRTITSFYFIKWDVLFNLRRKKSFSIRHILLLHQHGRNVQFKTLPLIWDILFNQGHPSRSSMTTSCSINEVLLTKDILFSQWCFTLSTMGTSCSIKDFAFNKDIMFDLIYPIQSRTSCSFINDKRFAQSRTLRTFYSVEDVQFVQESPIQ